MFIITILIFAQWCNKDAGLLWYDGQWEAPKTTIFVIMMIQNCTNLYTGVVQQNNKSLFQLTVVCSTAGRWEELSEWSVVSVEVFWVYFGSSRNHLGF